MLITAAEEQRLDLITPKDPNRRGGSIMLRMPGDAALLQDEIATDGRGRVLRLSPGVITSDAGVSALITGLARHVRG
jgi:hypothetical protein